MLKQVILFFCASSHLFHAYFHNYHEQFVGGPGCIAGIHESWFAWGTKNNVMYEYDYYSAEVMWN